MTEGNKSVKGAVQSRTAVLFADVAGSSALYREVGDTAAEGLIRKALARMQAVCEKFGGAVIKTIGDEVMCRYPTGAAAANAAMEMQTQTLTPLEEGGRALRLRIGFAYGDALEREGDVFGDVVNIAARLTAMAKAGQVLTTESTAAAFDRDLRSSTRLFDKTPVKGIKEEITVVQILWDRRNQTNIVAVRPSETVMSMKLRIDYQGREFMFTPADLPRRIGREQDCDIVVPTEFASRHHARVEYNRGKFMLVDESSNGTYVEVEDSRMKSKRVVYVRNESFAMVGEGRFSLGTRPESDSHVLTFHTL